MGMYPSGHSNPGVQAIIYLLNDWTDAIENDSYLMRMPDLDYVRPDQKEWWTEEQLDKLIRSIDAEIDMEVPRAPGTSTGSKAGPGLFRLPLAQRLALAQQLEILLVKYNGHIQILATPKLSIKNYHFELSPSDDNKQVQVMFRNEIVMAYTAEELKSKLTMIIDDQYTD